MKSFEDIANESLEEAKQRQGEDNNKLLEQLKSINHQIANYPTPIAGCDAQFNFLLEEKERISKIITFNKEHKTNTKEIDGPKGPEPTRYGDWEKKVLLPIFNLFI